MSRAAVVAVAVLALLVGTSGPASAQGLSFTDPAGDAAGRGLDITHVTVRNGDRGITARVKFRRVMRGDLIIGVQTRSGLGAALISEHRPVRGDRNFVETAGGDRCRAFAVTWNADAQAAAMRMPARCLRGGNYGALRFFVLTEDSPDRGVDIDVAPNVDGTQQTPWTGWVPRG
jgi:hypothetical protein